MDQESGTVKAKPGADAGKSGAEIHDAARILVVDDEPQMRALCLRARG